MRWGGSAIGSLGLMVACVGQPPAPPSQSTDGSGGSGPTVGADGSGTAGPSAETVADSTGGTSQGTKSTETGTPSTASGSETGPVVEFEVLQRASFDACDLPLWCHAGNPLDPVGGSIWVQECFFASTAPPFELTEVQVVIRGLAEELTDVFIQVYQAGPEEPDRVIDSRVVDVDALTIGINTIAVEPPIVVSTSAVCLGLSAPGSGLSGALGVSVDPGSQEPEASYVRLIGDGCDFPEWNDVVELDALPAGNWCVRGTIAKEVGP